MPIQYFAEQQLFLITTHNTAYAFCHNKEQDLVHVYWGEKLPYPEDYHIFPLRVLSSFNSSSHELLAEYPDRSGIQNNEPCLRATFAEGTRDVRLRYATHQIEGEELTLHLKEQFYGLEVVLRYRVFADCDMLARRVELTNSGESPITLEQVLSGALPLPFDRDNFRLTHLSGAWAVETQLDRPLITPGRKVLEGRLNYSGHAANPFFALDALDAEGQGATETRGEVWFGVVQWSGNWKIVIEQSRSPYKVTRVAAGLNDYDFGWQLEPQTRFESPWLALGYSNAGFGQMSRNLHRYEINHVLPKAFAADLRPVLYNSWEAVLFNVTETAQMELAEKAAQIGSEVFVIDDGWFGQRHNDRAGLGDWYVNSQKFPNGLKPLIDKVNALGMIFGIWVEPEMVNPDSDLYRAHPDWAYHFPNREPITGRNQLILNLCREDVQEWLFEWLDKLLSENNVGYVKWDYNRGMSEPGWPEAPQAQQREIWVRHIQAFYKLVDRLRGNHPGVLFEACSGGGGRADLGALSHFDHVWTSDNTDPLDRLPIQLGYSLVHSPKTMYCWVTDTDWNSQYKYDLRYRFHSSFMGSLGIGSNLNDFSPEELAEATKYVAEYKTIRPLIQHGLFYRLTPLSETTSLAAEYLAEDKRAGVVLAFNHRPHFWQIPRRLRLQGLAPDAIYSLRGDIVEGEPTSLSGQALMQRGITPKFTRHFGSALIQLSKNE